MLKPPAPLPGARLLFSLDPAVAHLNHGSAGAVPIAVQRTQQRLRDEMEASPHRFFAGGLPDRVGHVRAHLARALGADPDAAALVPNATAGVALALRSVAPGREQEILTTDHLFGPVRLALEHWGRRTGVLHRTVHIPLGAGDEEATGILAAAVDPSRTRMVLIDQVAATTARRFPVAAMVAAVRRRAPETVVVVDGAHGPGMLDSPARSLGADFWVGNLHKWGFAPRATALLTVSPRWRDRIEPAVVSWYIEDGFPRAVEMQGTQDLTSWLSAPAGLFVLRSLGWQDVREHNAAMAAYGQQVVGAALGVAPRDLPDPGPEVAMRLVPLPDGIATDPAGALDLRTRIEQSLATEVAVSCWRGRGYLRLSAQVYNLAEEYERLAAGLARVLGDPRA